MAMWKKKGTFTSTHAIFDSYSFTEQCKLHRTPWYNVLHLLWEYTGWPVTPKDKQVPCFRRVFLTLHVMFSCMTGIYLLNSTSSPQHSHQNFVLKEDDSLGQEKSKYCPSQIEMTKRRRELSWMLTWRWLGVAAKKAGRFMRTVTEKKLQNQNLLIATVQDNRTSLQGNWLTKPEGHSVRQKQVNKAMALRS